VGLTLVDGGTYYFSVRSVYQGTPGTATTSDGITVDATAPTSAVSQLPAEVGTTTFTVTWTGSDAGSGIEQFDIQVSSDGGSSWVGWLTGTTLTSSGYTGLNGHTYHFRSRAHDNAGNVEAYPATPDAHTTVNLSTSIAWVNDGLGLDEDWSLSASSLSANWEEAAYADEYEYALGTTAGGTEVVGWTSTGVVTHVTRVGLTLVDGGTYYFSVRSVYQGTPGTATTSDGITVDATAPASAVSPLAAEVGTETFTVTWSGSDAVSGIKHYNVQVSSDGGSSWGSWLTGTVLTSSDFPGVNGTTYYFRSRAHDIAGNVEDYPSVADAHTTVNLAAGLQVAWVRDGLTLGNDDDWTNQSATLYAHWEAVAGADGYEAAIGTSPGGTDIMDWYLVYMTSIATCTLPLVNGGTYYYSVRVVVGASHGAAVSSDGITLDTGLPSSSVQALPAVTSNISFTVSWSGTDALSGVNAYDVQVKDGGGEWQDWLVGTGLTQSAFYAEVDHTYYFRSRAADGAANFEAYPTEADAQTCVTCTFAYERDWGQEGTGPGDFKLPFNVAVDGLGRVYVAESDNARVQVFDPSGTLLRQIGSHGFVDSLLWQAAGVAIDDSGYVYVTDFNADKVKKYTSEGAFVLAWGGSGSGENQMDYPRGITVDDSFYVYVAEQGNDRVHKFTSGGVSVKTWGGYGTADGQFRGCMSVAVSPSGDIYALDQNNHRIQQFTSDGVFVRKWGSYGSADGQFSSIDFIAVDASGHVYVTQQGDCRIQRFTPEGVFLNKWGGCGSGDGQFLDEPFGIAVGADGTVYVTDLSACRVVKFTATCP
jgi:hypothetical protein